MLSDVLTIQGEGMNRISIAKILLLFYVLIASGCTENLLPKQTREIIQQNRYVQHLIGFMTLFLLITLVDDAIDTRTALAYALLGYVWFIFSTKVDAHWSIAIILLLFAGYLYEHSMNIRIKEINTDKNLTDLQKTQLLTNITNVKTWIVGSIIMVTILGTLFYSQKKQEQYGGGYDVFAYILD
jgi:hypothetical protein